MHIAFPGGEPGPGAGIEPARAVLVHKPRYHYATPG